MDDNAISYEFLIRRAHNCGRYGAAGANADIFRELQRLAHIYLSEKEAIKEKKERLWSKSEDEMLTEYMFSAGEVSAYTKTAIDLLKRKYKEKLSEDQYAELGSVESSLSFSNLETINTAIERVETVLNNIEL